MVTPNRTVCHACHSRVFCLWELLCTSLSPQCKGSCLKAFHVHECSCLIKIWFACAKQLDLTALLSSGARSRGKHSFQNLHYQMCRTLRIFFSNSSGSQDAHLPALLLPPPPAPTTMDSGPQTLPTHKLISGVLHNSLSPCSFPLLLLLFIPRYYRDLATVSNVCIVNCRLFVYWV